MENSENILQPENSVITSEQVKTYLLETSKWGKFIAIVGFVGLGLLVLFSLFFMFGFSKMGMMPQGVNFPVGALGIIYIGIAVLYYFPISYLFRFSVQIRKGLDTNESQSIIIGFESLKSLFKFMGITTIVILSIYALVLLIAIPMGLMM
ncbi:MAG: hypothetical protein H6538_00240 [Bacteroidales bacterium]|nr:hypothetical protein [Bacteroidales bacterium]MCB8998661.1 hypothetical protein [Bacteroidales bacterium]MCB9012471.1 hypothetical protein [Bacteroidales bacterium]